MSFLKQKAISGVTWSFIDNISNSGVTFLVGLILARLLTPAEFGILGMITVLLAVSNSIIDSGFSQALIRKIDLKPIDYNTVFIFNLIVAFLLCALLLWSAPAISLFFKEPALTSVTRVMSLLLIINAFSIIPRTLLTKSIDFKKQTKASLISSLLSGVIGIGMAYGNLGVWSLVGQVLSKQLLYTILLWISVRWKPAIEFSLASFTELYKFGANLLVSGLLETIYKNIYTLVIGRYYSSSQLGQYTRAELFTTIFSTNLTMAIQRVSYPALSTIQHDDERLKEAYRRVIKCTMLVTFLLMLGLSAVAYPLIIILIGDKWLVAASFLQILCLAQMFYPLHAINLNVLNVKGRSDLFLKLEMIKKIIAIPVIVVGIFKGILFMLWGSVILSLISYFLNSYFSGRLLNYSSRAQIADLLPGFLIATFVALVMWSITFLHLSSWSIIILQCLTGGIMTIAINEKIKLSEYLDIKHILFTIAKRR